MEKVKIGNPDVNTRVQMTLNELHREFQLLLFFLHPWWCATQQMVMVVHERCRKSS
jgi:hypothetical protein